MTQENFIEIAKISIKPAINRYIKPATYWRLVLVAKYAFPAGWNHCFRFTYAMAGLMRGVNGERELPITKATGERYGIVNMPQ